jgi:hypothetical protein
MLVSKDATRKTLLGSRLQSRRRGRSCERPAAVGSPPDTGANGGGANPIRSALSGQAVTDLPSADGSRTRIPGDEAVPRDLRSLLTGLGSLQ